jgi:hypothetical protein
MTMTIFSTLPLTTLPLLHLPPFPLLLLPQFYSCPHPCSHSRSYLQTYLCSNFCSNHVHSRTRGLGEVIISLYFSPSFFLLPLLSLVANISRCVGTSQYQSCDRQIWQPTQSCQSGLVCQPSESWIYCVRP